VIDPEFAFYGPMGFDTGAFLANLLLAFFSMPGHGAPDGDYAEWLLAEISVFYNTFSSTFLQLWAQTSASGAGEAYRLGPFPDDASTAAAKQRYMAALWRDTVGFAGMKMIRRIVGIAHVADLDEIADADVRATCEKRAILLARQMVFFGAGSSSVSAAFADISDLVNSARKLAASDDLVYPSV